MGLLSRIAGMFRAKGDPADDAQFFGVPAGWGASIAGVPVTSSSALQHVACLACTSILSEDVAKLPILISRRLDNGGKAPARDHWFYQLIRKPNAWQTRFEFMEMMQAALVLRGNAYAVILRDGRGTPTALVPIHPDRVGIWESPDGSWFYWVTPVGLHEIAALRSLPSMIPSDDVLHVRWLSTWNSLVGSSRISLMREALGLGISMEHHAAGLMGRGARPGGILETDVLLGKEVRENLAQSWQDTYGGPGRGGKTAVLEQGLRWKPLTMTMVDAEFMDGRRFQLADIARGFRVPLYKLAIEVSNTESSMVQQDQEYLNGVISTYCDRYVEKFHLSFDIDPDEFVIEFDYSRFLKADIQTRLTALRTGVIGMIYTPNEARAGEGLPPVEGGDTLYQPTNMAPIGFTPAGKASGPGSDLTGAPAEGGDGDPAQVPGNPSGDQPAPTTSFDAPHLRLIGQDR